MDKKTIRFQQMDPVEIDAFLRDGFLIRDNVHPPGKHFPPHNHDYFELEIISDGSAVHTYNDQTYDAFAGHTYLLSYNDIHSFKANERTRIINIRFTESFIDPQLASLLLTPSVSCVCFFNESELSEIMKSVTVLMHEQKTRPGLYNIRAKNIISDIIISLLRKSSDSVHLPSDNVLKASNIIIKNFKTDITLASLSAELNLSPDHLGKLLKNNTGLSFNEFLNRLRIRHACRLLINSDLSVKEIAFDCGYNSVEYFMRCFKAINSQTPMEYKRRHVQGI